MTEPFTQINLLPFFRHIGSIVQGSRYIDSGAMPVGVTEVKNIEEKKTAVLQAAGQVFGESLNIFSKQRPKREAYT